VRGRTSTSDTASGYLKGLAILGALALEIAGVICMTLR
jgi:hypothetical protein